MVWKPANPQLELVLPGAPASQFHSADVEPRARQTKRSGSLIRQALYLDQEDAYAAGEVGFLARALVQATLPHSDPKANEFVRRNGHFTLSILAPTDVGLPFGRYLRLVLAYLTTEAVRRKSPDIELGSHFSHFCAALGIPPTTGPRGSLPTLREQLQRLFASTFRCIFHDESQGRHAGDGFLIAEKLELWWDPRPGKGEATWGSHVLLSDRFFREATEAPVPLDLRVLRALRSPFEIDIYVWLTWRFFRLRRQVTIPWPRWRFSSVRGTPIPAASRSGSSATCGAHRLLPGGEAREHRRRSLAEAVANPHRAEVGQAVKAAA